MLSHCHAKFLSCLLGGIFLPLPTALAAPPIPGGATGHVYVLTNQPTGNAVMVFRRDASGRLTRKGTFASGGNGAGAGTDPLQSQNPVVLNEDGSLLFAVNAGSNSVTVFRVSGDTLTATSTVSSGGTMPVGLTVRGNLVYVVNAGGVPNISGFKVDEGIGQLRRLAESTQPLPGGASAAPAEVSFVPGESVLLVTEKGTDQIDTFTLDGDGMAQTGMAFPSRKPTPFGFAFAPHQIGIVSDAVMGKPLAAALSSYKIREGRRPKTISAAVPDTQTAACWVAVTEDGAYAYTANTGSNTVSSYSVSVGGNLTLLNAMAAGANVPTDTALSKGSKFLYVRNGGDGTVEGFAVNSDGSLTTVSITGKLPDGAAGLAAR
ncbi:MAG TPA: beta-propeller fold lactonase family protein [Rhizomicrobium sp.]